MLLRAQKPFALTCGGIFDANLNTFMKVSINKFSIFDIPLIFLISDNENSLHHC